MEDQQPATGHLTDGAGNDESGAGAAVDTERVETGQGEADAGENGQSAETSVEPDGGENGDLAAESTETDGGEAGAVAFRHRRPAGRRIIAAAVVAAALFVGAAAFAGAMMQPYLTDRATVATKLQVARTAANAITTLWTYTPENMDSLADRAAAYLSGDFEAQYRKFVDAIVAPNKQAKVTNSTQVTGAAVESLDGPNAIAIVYTNSTSTSPVTKNVPSLKYLSYRLFMKRDHERWLVTRMTTITSLDLTPQM